MQWSGRNENPHQNKRKMPKKEVKPIPEGFHTVTPYLTIKGVARLLDFLRDAFGAQELHRSSGPDGRIIHAQVKIGNSMVMIGEAGEEWPARPSTIFLYVENADATYQAALNAGGQVVRELKNEFYGDRMGGIKDPSGNDWWIATHIEDVSPEEMARREAAQWGQGR